MKCWQRPLRDEWPDSPSSESSKNSMLVQSLRYPPATPARQRSTYRGRVHHTSHQMSTSSMAAVPTAAPVQSRRRRPRPDASPYRGWPERRRSAAPPDSTPLSCGLPTTAAPTAEDLERPAHAHHYGVPRDVGGHDPQIGRGPDEMQRPRRNLKNSGDNYSDPLRRGQDCKTGHG
jgi:hypothetical protein